MAFRTRRTGRDAVVAAPVRSVIGVCLSWLLLGGSGQTAAAAQGSLGELVDPDTLRVCADPNNLPYSNQAGEGFENKIAELLADALGREVGYTWFPQSMGFVRNTLGARRCDLVIGVATTNQLMQNTNPYYRSTYVLLQRADAKDQVESLHDIALEDLRVGVIERTPPVSVLAREGLLDHVVPYNLVVDTRFASPGRDLVEDVATGEIDVGVVWGPIAGYWAQKQGVPVRLLPLASESEGERLDFRISMGLRRGEPEWKRTLNDLLAEHRAKIQDILLDYGVPLLDEQGRLISPKIQGGGGSEQKTEVIVPEHPGGAVGVAERSLALHHAPVKER